MSVEILHGCCLETMAAMKAAGRTFASIVTDPPYHLTQNSRGGSPRTNNPATPFGRHRLADRGFMGQQWDGGDVAMRPDTWRLALDVLEPGGMLAAFGGARTQHRMACAIEDAGFEIRDCALWLYGTGFPKGKAQLKPAYEPIILARKPGALRPLAIDACRIATNEVLTGGTGTTGKHKGWDRPWMHDGKARDNYRSTNGRYPANILHDGSDEVLEAFAAFGESKSRSGGITCRTGDGLKFGMGTAPRTGHDDGGTAARFFYCAKASRAERAGASHPTIKPLSLCRWIVRLITPPGGTVLDIFAGSGTTGLACLAEGLDCTLVEREAEYVEMIRRRLGETIELEAAD